jgi:GNAT superfamily N-acetyltransferase
VRPPDVAALEAAMGEERGLVKLRLERGCRAFLVTTVAGVPAGYGWLSTGAEWIGELSLAITPGPGEAYVWNCVTLLAHRRQGAFATLLAFLVGCARSEGLRRLWIGSVDGGAESAVIAAGFRPRVRFRALELGPLRAVLLSAQSEVLGGGRIRVARASRRVH